MARVLVCYGSSEGQTAKIADHIGDVLSEASHDVVLSTAKYPPSALTSSEFAYDGVVIGASIHKGSHQGYVEEFVREYVDGLNRVPSAFFSVSLSAAKSSPEARSESDGYLREFVAETDWEPDLTHAVAGALKYSEYGFLTRFVMKRIAGTEGLDTDTDHDYEYTDWEDVETFAIEFEELVSTRAT
ncbi:flavodoxin domain-containing protein [Halostagnicola sp. A-GB9-2]|uniref:flavodoxin domain-containing protein n=1 Tax=Halostagnicola sp. A-GB9-2 TaxID=3048066 RepID=UPI0024C079C3|nr:flavodoxin domain-containing protein [Halostagnicola sp. A-GB9-2]MDJ1432404.1 flavodoxin domain-containing protein [Halostagnicola sp. A-GB9-2]